MDFKNHSWKDIKQWGQRLCSDVSAFGSGGVALKAALFTLVFLAAPEDLDQVKSERAPLIELTYNWDGEVYQGGRNFGHLAFAVDDVYAVCRKALDAGITINVPPRDGHMAFFRSSPSWTRDTR